VDRERPVAVTVHGVNHAIFLGKTMISAPDGHIQLTFSGEIFENT
jgi:hypothetical protein